MLEKDSGDHLLNYLRSKPGSTISVSVTFETVYMKLIKATSKR